MVAGFQEVNKMNGIHDDQDMEQRSLPVVLFVLAVVLFVLAFCLATGFVIKEIDIEYFSLKQAWSDCCKWLHWRIMPGRLLH